jgi:hypothetical protein
MVNLFSSTTALETQGVSISSYGQIFALTIGNINFVESDSSQSKSDYSVSYYFFQYILGHQNPLQLSTIVSTEVFSTK